MLTAAQLAQARAAQRMLMTAEVTMYGPADGYDLIGGTEVPRRGPVLYQGPGRLQPDRQNRSTTLAGSVPVAVTTFIGAVPWDVVPVNGATVTVNAPDGLLSGSVFRIVDVEQSSLGPTCRRFRAEHVTDLRPQT